jgi:lipoprotein NlpD
MSSHVKFTIACLLFLLVAACSSGSIRAPIDSRSHHANPKSTPSTTTSPARAGRSYSTSSATHYVVRSGDTLYSISRKYGMEFWQLASINGIRPPYNIYAGQRLSLRDKAGAGAVSAPVSTAGMPQPESAPKVTDNNVEKPAADTTGKVTEFDGNWQWPTRGRLLRGYKPNEPGKKGINIGGHNEQPVKAAASGKVVYVGSGLVGYGRLIIIRHNEELLSTYGHNSILLVEEGEAVEAGQVIAKMGSSGTDRTELYFEIRKDGKPVDPLAYLPGQP